MKIYYRLIGFLLESQQYSTFLCLHFHYGRSRLEVVQDLSKGFNKTFIFIFSIFIIAFLVLDFPLSSHSFYFFQYASLSNLFNFVK